MPAAIAHVTVRLYDFILQHCKQALAVDFNRGGVARGELCDSCPIGEVFRHKGFCGLGGLWYRRVRGLVISVPWFAVSGALSAMASNSRLVYRCHHPYLFGIFMSAASPNPLLLATPVYALLLFLSQWPGAPEQVR